MSQSRLGALSAIAITLVASTASAQFRPQREPFDTSGFMVVIGLLVLGVVAYFLARGRGN